MLFTSLFAEVVAAAPYSSATGGGGSGGPPLNITERYIANHQQSSSQSAAAQPPGTSQIQMNLFDSAETRFNYVRNSGPDENVSETSVDVPLMNLTRTVSFTDDRQIESNSRLLTVDGSFNKSFSFGGLFKEETSSKLPVNFALLSIPSPSSFDTTRYQFLGSKLALKSDANKLKPSNFMKIYGSIEPQYRSGTSDGVISEQRNRIDLQTINNDARLQVIPLNGARNGFLSNYPSKNMAGFRNRGDWRRNVHEIPRVGFSSPEIAYHNGQDSMAGYPISNAGMITNNDIELGIGESLVDSLPLTNPEETVYNQDNRALKFLSPHRIEELVNGKGQTAIATRRQLKEAVSRIPSLMGPSNSLSEMRKQAVLRRYVFPGVQPLDNAVELSEVHDDDVDSVISEIRGGNLKVL